MQLQTTETMSKRTLFLLAAAALAAFSLVSCKEPVTPDNPDDPQPEDLLPVVPTVEVNQDWVFYDGKPVFVINVENPNPVEVTAEASVSISTDKQKAFTSFTASDVIPANSTKTMEVSQPETIPAGFYKARILVNKVFAKTFIFGVDPTEIVSAPDKQADFDEYWDSAIAQLEAVEMKDTLIEIPAYSTSLVKVYMVELQSVPDEPDGEPAVIHGYYVETQDGEKHPVLMHYYGYDDLKNISKIYCPSGNGLFAEFYLSTRGQIINNRTADKRSDGIDIDFANTYGDWFAFNFGKKDGYYYRGAFMDCVQGIRFMATRSTSDMTNVFAEGKSQGGAFSYAAAALSPIPLRAIAPGVAFLGDFPDYFSIVDWPANVAKSNKGDMTDDEMYAFLSYFDTKNLATRISCSIIANLGLQDVTCPPHTNIAPFNNAQTTDKEMHYYPKMGHDIPKDWEAKYLKYFKARIQ